MSLVLKNDLASAFSVNVVLIAPRADSGAVCFGVSFAVYSVMVFFWLLLQHHSLACCGFHVSEGQS